MTQTTPAASALRFATLGIGDALPERAFTPTIAELFLYSAIIWNAHRIHYDLPYTQGDEGYPGLLITGPLQGDWLCQAVTDWMGDEGTLERFTFTHRKGAFLGETLTTGGQVTGRNATSGEVTLALWVRNAQGEVVTPGEARVRFRPQ